MVRCCLEPDNSLSIDSRLILLVQGLVDSWSHGPSGTHCLCDFHIPSSILETYASAEALWRLTRRLEIEVSSSSAASPRL